MNDLSLMTAEEMFAAGVMLSFVLAAFSGALFATAWWLSLREQDVRREIDDRCSRRP